MARNGMCFYPPDFRRGISNRWILTARPDPELENPGAGGRYAPLNPEAPSVSNCPDCESCLLEHYSAIAEQPGLLAVISVDSKVIRVRE